VVVIVDIVCGFVYESSMLNCCIVTLLCYWILDVQMKVSVSRSASDTHRLFSVLCEFVYEFILYKHVSDGGRPVSGGAKTTGCSSCINCTCAPQPAPRNRVAWPAMLYC